MNEEQKNNITEKNPETGKRRAYAYPSAMRTAHYHRRHGGRQYHAR